MGILLDKVSDLRAVQPAFVDAHRTGCEPSSLTFPRLSLDCRFLAALGEIYFELSACFR
jgi:hypothetical protein